MHLDRLSCPCRIHTGYCGFPKSPRHHPDCAEVETRRGVTQRGRGNQPLLKLFIPQRGSEGERRRERDVDAVGEIEAIMLNVNVAMRVKHSV